jgi:hypothetical protein
MPCLSVGCAVHLVFGGGDWGFGISLEVNTQDSVSFLLAYAVVGFVNQSQIVMR